MTDLEAWIETTLKNDEASTDAELIAHFEQAGGVSHAEACFYVAQRGAALMAPLQFELVAWPLANLLPPRSGSAGGLF